MLNEINLNFFSCGRRDSVDSKARLIADGKHV